MRKHYKANHDNRCFDAYSRNEVPRFGGFVNCTSERMSFAVSLATAMLKVYTFSQGWKTRIFD